MCQHNLPCSIVYAHCLLPGRAFASLYVLLFLEKEAEIGGRGQDIEIKCLDRTTGLDIEIKCLDRTTGLDIEIKCLG